MGHKFVQGNGFFFISYYIESEGHAWWCSGESCLTESPGRGVEAASPQILREEGLPRFFPSPNPTHVEASGTGSAPFIILSLLLSLTSWDF